jgi:sugar phosphate isomerase/epimerase
MKFGYMSGFRGDLFEEIEFAKKYFDFTEITIQPELLKSIDDIIDELKKVTAGFEVLGHVHWEITDYHDIIRNIEVLRDIGAKKITIHPFQSLSIEENAKIFNQLSGFMQNSGLELLIENVSGAPYNSAENILKLLEQIPTANLTLDIGHANRNGELDKFMEIPKPRIYHIHLHDNVGNSDHLFYESKGKLQEIILKIKSFGYDGTVLLETFSVMKNSINASQELPIIKELHIEQLQKIRK